MRLKESYRAARRNSPTAFKRLSGSSWKKAFDEAIVKRKEVPAVRENKRDRSEDLPTTLSFSTPEAYLD